MNARTGTFRALWGWPIVLGLLTASGLLTALVSDTWGDWWSWVGLGVPVAVMGWFGWPRRCADAADGLAQPALGDPGAPDGPPPGQR
ncbi:hypothetical protein [Paracidovorax sp. MALMAid1276]|uniref:hypothetical protein n=1 Tax=Paracidovorax sp. MALMAid1276 TaxID=3411631 RepID=UPI003B9D62AD